MPNVLILDWRDRERGGKLCGIINSIEKTHAEHPEEEPLSLHGYSLLLAHANDFNFTERHKLTTEATNRGCPIVWYTASYGIDLLHLVNGNEYSQDQWTGCINVLSSTHDIQQIPREMIDRLQKRHIKEFIQMCSPVALFTHDECSTFISYLASHVAKQVTEKAAANPSWKKIIEEQSPSHFDACVTAIREIGSGDQENCRTNLSTISRMLSDMSRRLL